MLNVASWVFIRGTGLVDRSFFSSPGIMTPEQRMTQEGKFWIGRGMDEESTKERKMGECLRMAYLSALIIHTNRFQCKVVSNLKNPFPYGNEGHDLFWQQIPLANCISHRLKLKLIFTLDHTVAVCWRKVVELSWGQGPASSRWRIRRSEFFTWQSTSQMGMQEEGKIGMLLMSIQTGFRTELFN